MEHLAPVCTLSDIEAFQAEAAKVFIHEDIKKYIIQIIHATRTHEQVGNRYGIQYLFYNRDSK